MYAYPLTNFQPAAVSSPRELTEIICWSRMQAEAGQDLASIVSRKELERSAGDGVFCWGVGNAASRAVAFHARDASEIDVVFSIMKSRPKQIDVAPTQVLIWRSYFDHNGTERSLPANSLITSRGGNGARTKESHYALMCRSETPLELGDFGPFDPAAYRNVSATGAPIGASQVTALLRRVNTECSNGAYRINLRAKFTKSYWVKLSDPIDLSHSKQALLKLSLADINSYSVDDWLDLISELRAHSGRTIVKAREQLSLF